MIVLEVHTNQALNIESVEFVVDEGVGLGEGPTKAGALPVVIVDIPQRVITLYN